jgi:hypothetical protein
MRMARTDHPPTLADLSPKLLVSAADFSQLLRRKSQLAIGESSQPLRRGWKNLKENFAGWRNSDTEQVFNKEPGVPSLPSAAGPATAADENG